MIKKHNPGTIKLMVIAVIVAGILGALTVMAIENFGNTGIKIFAICLVLIVCGIMATVSLVVGERAEYKTLGAAGMIVSALVFLLTLIVIIGEIENVGFLKFVFSLFILSVGLSHISLLHYFSIQNKYARYARMTATVAISLFSILLITRIFGTFGPYYESLMYSQATYKISLVAFLFDLAATLLVPLCNRLDIPEKIEIDFDEGPVQEIEKKDEGV